MPFLSFLSLPQKDQRARSKTWTEADAIQSVTKKVKRPKPWDRILNRNTTTSEAKSKSSLGSAAYPSADTFINMTKQHSDVFPPLKSVARGLATVLKDYAVCSVSLSTPICDADGHRSKQRPIDEQWNL